MDCIRIIICLFAALTSILAKIGIENINSNLAVAIRTVINKKYQKNGCRTAAEMRVLPIFRKICRAPSNLLR
jgi:uncharacterized membrane protein